MNDWKKRWRGKEMDQAAREEKRSIKKKKVRANRNACRKAMRNGDYENNSVTDWDDLDGNDDG